MTGFQNRDNLVHVGLPPLVVTQLETELLNSSNSYGATQAFTGSSVYLKLSSSAGITANAGGGSSGAAAVVSEITMVSTVGTAADSVILPTSAAGLDLILVNNASNPMQVFAQSGDTINAVASVSQMQKSLVLYACSSAGTYIAEGIGSGFSGQLPTVSAAAGITANAGGGSSGATLLTVAINRVDTVGSSSDSVKLPATSPGLQITVSNPTSAQLAVFPNSSADSINAGSGGAMFAVASSKTAQFTCAKINQWHSILSA